MKIIGTVFIVTIVLAFALRILGFRSMRYVRGKNSMCPTIAAEDICLCFMKKEFCASELHRGMIVLFKHEGSSFLLTKRIIAVEGDIIEIRENKTFVNGEKLDESYIRRDTVIRDGGNVNKVQVPPSKLFVMGDNRENSMDSRYSQFGLIDVNQVVGKPLLILWSNNRRNIGKWLQ